MYQNRTYQQAYNSSKNQNEILRHKIKRKNKENATLKRYINKIKKDRNDCCCCFLIEN